MKTLGIDARFEIIEHDLEDLRETRCKLFNSLTALDLDRATVTIDAIAYRMPPNSSLIADINTSNGDASIYPIDYGLLRVTKGGSTNRVSFVFENVDTIWQGFYTIVTGVGKWGGWLKQEKQYTSLEAIGLTQGTETMETIANAMPNFSRLTYGKTGSYGNQTAGVYPNNGQVTVCKGSSTAKVIFTLDREETMYRGFFNTSATPTWSGWRKVSLMLQTSGALDFTTIPVYSTKEMTLACTGVKVNDFIIATPNAVLPANVTYCSYCDTVDVIKIRIANLTNGVITVGSKTWHAMVIKNNT